eukprot:1150099-Pelagomonas_calceolata.AAC.9
MLAAAHERWPEAGVAAWLCTASPQHAHQLRIRFHHQSIHQAASGCSATHGLGFHHQSIHQAAAQLTG